MKKLSFIATGMVVAFLALTSCEENEAGPNTVDELELEADLTADMTYEEVDNITEGAIQFTASNPGAREADQDTSAYITCAVAVSVDTENNQVTVDYGEEGCTGPWGVTRQGKVIITYSGRWYEEGATRITTFDNFFVDGVQVEGTRTVTNTSDFNTSPNPVFNVTMEDGRLTFPDGTIMTRDASFTRTWFRAPNPANDRVLREGSANGVTRRGDNYSVTIEEPNEYKRCRAIPLDGTKRIVVGEREALLDYGDGACDNFVDITFNGETNQRRIFARR